MMEDSFPSSLPRSDHVRNPLGEPLECPSRKPLKYLPLYLRHPSRPATRDTPWPLQCDFGRGTEATSSR